ncbi:hypothetical protein UNSW1_85 [Campylobacter concisus UNSW1]|nr:hypothetical protein UNSW1_85 [Campylobacter concisus UNSW1]
MLLSIKFKRSLQLKVIKREANSIFEKVFLLHFFKYTLCVTSQSI